MITAKDIRNLAVWAYNVDLDQFALQVYGAKDVDYYHIGKWQKFQKNPLAILGTLDQDSLARVATIINNYGG